MNKLGRGFLLGGIIGIAVTQMVAPSPMWRWQKRMRLGTKKAFRAMQIMKRIL